MFLRIFVICFSLLYMVSQIEGHGRLIDPPSRVSAWRYGFKTPKEYGDNQWFCGGRDILIAADGKCGICGDNWNDPQPRASEAGGKFAKPKGKIVKTYTPGQVIEVSVEITANHLGYFEYKLCKVTNPYVPVTEECLNGNPLPISDGSGTKFYLDSGTGIYTVKLQLPENFACDHCVLQWRYWTGNHNGYCEDGTHAKGCGPQEEFRACSDIAITNGDGGVTPPIVKSSTAAPIVPTTTTTTTTKGGNGPIPDGDCSSSTGYLRDPNDCARFFQCVKQAFGGGWKKVSMSCPSGLAFNQAITTCDWPNNVAGC